MLENHMPTSVSDHLRLPSVGAFPLPAKQGGGCRFTVWAPKCRDLSLVLCGPVEKERVLPMQRQDHGYFSLTVPEAGPGDDYMFQLPGGKILPDPASRFQPDGVFGPSRVVRHEDFAWNDCGFPGMPLDEAVIYELHIGTFTSQGTFDAAIGQLEDLARLGVTCLEIMPVAQFSGRRNWGYDGVFPYAVHNGYAGPDGLKRFVEAAHCLGMAVILDAVYNHIGPEGNVLHAFGHYFTDTYATPWGQAVNFDGPHSDPVRAFFLDNARQWFEDFHIDGLRLDAVQAIHDTSCRPILAELCTLAAHLGPGMGKKLCMIAESDANDARTVLPREQGGLGMDGQWSDDFHHAVHALLTHETYGYYKDFGAMAHVADALAHGFAYTGQYSRYWKRCRGSSPAALEPRTFVTCIQNHDQVGNRPCGERLDSLIPFEARKLAAACLLLGQHTPMLFMGEEYGEDNPFQYFVNFHNPSLNRAVRKGRQKEMRHFRWPSVPPDPDAETTFRASCLDWNKRERAPHCHILALYRKLLDMRATFFPHTDAHQWNSYVCLDQDKKVLALRRKCHTKEVVALFHFSGRPVHYTFEQYFSEPGFHVLLDTSCKEFGGEGHGPVFPEADTVRLRPWQVLMLKAR